MTADIVRTCARCPGPRSRTQFTTDRGQKDGLSRLCCHCAYDNPAARAAKSTYDRSRTDRLYRFTEDVSNAVKRAVRRNRWARWIPRERRRATARGAPVVDDITVDSLEARWLNYDGRCAFCREPANGWDHSIPLSRGGGHSLAQLRVCCGSCNAAKGIQTLDEWDLAGFLLRRQNQPRLPRRAPAKPLLTAYA